MRRGCKKDANQNALSKYAEELGWFTFDASQFAQCKKGFPDSIWVRHGRVVLVECKTDDGVLTENEEEFFRLWPGEIYVVRTEEDVRRISEMGYKK